VELVLCTRPGLSPEDLRCERGWLGLELLDICEEQVSCGVRSDDIFRQCQRVPITGNKVPMERDEMTIFSQMEKTGSRDGDGRGLNEFGLIMFAVSLIPFGS